MSALSWRQMQILDLIRAAAAERGYPPTFTELMDSTGLSRAGVFYVLRELERKGWIRREPGQPRAIRLLEPEATR